MLLLLDTMGCGRSKNQSPKNGGQDVPDAKEKGAGRKKKSKGEKKENKDPKKTEIKVPNDNKLSPTRSSSNQCNSLKPPVLQTINGSSQQTLTIDVECPLNQDKLNPSKNKDVKEFAGKQTNIKITSSQLEFFKMLDEKIEQGRDYTSEEALDISTP